ncbi:MAG: DUF805 domain-containing protein [Methanimicrococcus sp.]|nr:DUF805 domain-containing protein [Methanimicrococcus sp.]
MKEYFSYEGRLNRKPYFLRNIGVIIAAFLFGFVWGIAELISDTLDIIFSYLSFVFLLICMVFLLFQSIKRLHDLDKSGWYLLIRLIAIIPFIGFVIVLIFDLYLFLAKGTEGPNRFGPDPLGRDPYDEGFIYVAGVHENGEAVYEEVIYEEVSYEEVNYEDKKREE